MTALKGPQHPDLTLYLGNYAQLLRIMKRYKEAAELEARFREYQYFKGKSGLQYFGAGEKEKHMK